MRAPLGVGLVLLVLSVLPSPAPARAQRGAATELVTLLVEVVSRDMRPVIPCGQMGAQPRAVEARVIAVEVGTFDEPSIHLMWPMCEFSRVQVGERHRIRVRRRVGVTPPGATYRVRWSERVP